MWPCQHHKICQLVAPVNREPGLELKTLSVLSPSKPLIMSVDRQGLQLGSSVCAWQEGNNKASRLLLTKRYLPGGLSSKRRSPDRLPTSISCVYLCPSGHREESCAEHGCIKVE